METELKLKVPAAELERLRRHPMLVGRTLGEPAEHQLVDTYYDTPERTLWKQGLTLRVRAEGGAWIQTVKTAAHASSSLHQRGEWECALPDATPQPALLAPQVKPAQVAELLASSELAGSLAPVFQNTTRRTTWRIAMDDGLLLECALDSGDIAAGGQHASISELELELKERDPAGLFRLALDLHHEVPLQLANDSKAARGYALLEPSRPLARKAAPVRLKDRMTLEEAFVAIGLNCLEQLESNVPGVLQKDVESLHQMRVGLRRLRALVDMFAPLAMPPGEVREGLDWLAGELGATRDWDVLAGATLDVVSGLEADALREAALARAETLHRQMVQTLRAPQYTRVILTVSGWLHARGWRAVGVLPTGSPLARPAVRALRPLLRRAEKRLENRIGRLDTGDAEARHRVRIAAKKARYAAEFFQDLLPRKRVKRYVGQLSRLQDQLGTLNDYAVAGRLLGELKGSNAQFARQAAYARGYLVATMDARSARLGKSLASVAALRLSR